MPKFVSEAAGKAKLSDAKRVAVNEAIHQNAASPQNRQFFGKTEVRMGGCSGCAGGNCEACMGGGKAKEKTILMKEALREEGIAALSHATGIEQTYVADDMHLVMKAKLDELRQQRNNQDHGQNTQADSISHFLAEEQRKRKRRELEGSKEPDKARMKDLTEQILKMRAELEEALTSKRKNLELALSDLECFSAKKPGFGSNP